MTVFGRLEVYAVLVYIVLMIVVGVRFSRRLTGGVDFFAGGRAVPWWVSGISLYMGNFSAWMFTGGAGFIYRTTGYGLLYFFLTQVCAYTVGSQLTAARWRRTRVISPVEFTLARFGISTQLLMTVIYSCMYVATAGVQLQALATLVHATLDVDLRAAVVVIGVVVMAYTVAGGVWTVVVTDVLQFLLLFAVVAVVAPLAVGLVDGGLGAVLGGIDLDATAAGGDPGNDVHYLVAGFLMFTVGVASGQGPRFYCVPDERDARRAGLLAGALFLTTPFLFALPPLAARLHWGPDLSALGWGDRPHEQVFLRIVQEVFSPGLVGVFLAAMFAASMSALDSVYNMVAAMLSRDVWMHLRPLATDRETLRVGRAATLLVGGSVIALALYYVHGRSDLFGRMMEIFFLSAPPLHVPIILGLLYRKAPRGAGLVCSLWGIGTGCLTKYGFGWSTGYQVYATVGTSAALFLLSPWLLPASERGAGAVAGLWRRLDTAVDVAREVGGRDRAARDVLRLVGGLTLLLAAMVAAMAGAEALTSAAGSVRPAHYAGVVAILAVLGALSWGAGRRHR